MITVPGLPRLPIRPTSRPLAWALASQTCYFQLLPLGWRPIIVSDGQLHRSATKFIFPRAGPGWRWGEGGGEGLVSWRAYILSKASDERKANTLLQARASTGC